MLEDFGVVLSAAASAIALAAATRSVFARLRDRSVRAELEQHGKRLHRLDVRLSAIVSELDELLASGIGWEGIGMWPTAIKGHLIYLDSIIDEVERTRAELRAIDTTGPADRLRQDLERMTAILHDAAQAYLSGTIDSYIEHEGATKPVRRAGARSHQRSRQPTREPSKVSGRSSRCSCEL